MFKVMTFIIYIIDSMFEELY